MIVWVNGAFGSGKTTLVEELRGRWPEALVGLVEEYRWPVLAPMTLVNPAYAA